MNLQSLFGRAFSDISRELPQREWNQGYMDTPVGIVLHYNGPPVGIMQDGVFTNYHHDSAYVLRQLAADARHQMRPGGLGVENGGDGLQYHLVIGPAGEVWQTQPLNRLLWHAANAFANKHCISIHIPIGGNQQPTEQQWTTTVRTFEALIEKFGMGGPAAVKGHREWSKTACPGPHLTRLLGRYRCGKTLTRYRVILPETRVRRDPADMTLNSVAAKLPAGYEFVSDGTKYGASVGGNTKWVHMLEPAPLGFIHSSLVQKIG